MERENHEENSTRLLHGEQEIMTKFVQLHTLTPYPPSNPNRDDLGRPKTVEIGGVMRQRISSQSLKKAWRSSETFQTTFSEELGLRSRDVYGAVLQNLLTGGVNEEAAAEYAGQLAKEFGGKEIKKANKDDATAEKRGAVLVHLSGKEITKLKALVEAIIANPDGDYEAAIEDLTSDDASIDVALFGRMIADRTNLNVEAAMEVSHAFTVTKANFEVDYWTGTSDSDPWFDAAKSVQDAGSGAAMIESRQFGGGTFYTYICINKDLLAANLGSEEQVRDVINAVIKTVATEAPAGNKTGFAQRPRAHYMLIEEGTSQPRNLSGAFTQAMPNASTPDEAVAALKEYKDRMDSAYGDSFDAREFGLGIGSLADALKE